METLFLCPDCGDEHGDPGPATLGHQVRCLDCQTEIELAIELRFVQVLPVAA